MSSACVALCTQLQPLYLSAPLREGKGKSMGLLWSGTKAVIKRCTRQSHTRHQELKSFACATLIFTPLVTHLCVYVCVSPSLPHFVTPTPLPSPLKLTQACIYLQSYQHTCMQTQTTPLLPWKHVITPCEVGAVWA